MDIFKYIERLVERLINVNLNKIHTHIPCQVVSYDETLNTCSLQPCIKKLRFNDSTNQMSIELPQLDDVPVQQIGSGKLIFTVPLTVGTYGLLHISERAIHNWLVNGGIVDPLSARKFDISDGVFVPGLFPYIEDGDNGQIMEPIKTDRISIRTRSGLTEISILNDESIEININDGNCNLAIDLDGNVNLTSVGNLTATIDGDATIEATNVNITGAFDVNGNLTVDE